MVADTVLIVRQLGRWRTLWLLCRMGRVDIALDLAARLLQTRFETLIASMWARSRRYRQTRFWLRKSVISSKGKGRLMR